MKPFTSDRIKQFVDEKGQQYPSLTLVPIQMSSPDQWSLSIRLGEQHIATVTNEVEFDTFTRACRQVREDEVKESTQTYTHTLELTETLISRLSVFADSGPASTRIIHTLLEFLARDFLTLEQQGRLKTTLMLHEECLLHPGLPETISCRDKAVLWSLSTVRQELEPYCLLQWKLKHLQWIIADTMTSPFHYRFGGLTPEKVRAHCGQEIERIRGSLSTRPQNCGKAGNCGFCATLDDANERQAHTSAGLSDLP